MCGAQYQSFLSILAPAQAGQGPEVIANLTTFLSNNFSSLSCGRRCYQQYQEAGNALYESCSAQLAPLNATYPLVTALGLFQPFRSQACGIDGSQGSVTSINCFEALQAQLSKASPVDIFTFDCNYGFQAFGVSNAAVLGGICATFKGLGGC